MNTKVRSAAALDATHAIGERGPRTMKARNTLAAYLDGKIYLRVSLVRRYCAYLEMVAKVST